MQLDVDRLVSDLEICVNHKKCDGCANLKFCSNYEYIVGIDYDYVIALLKAREILHESN